MKTKILILGLMLSALTGLAQFGPSAVVKYPYTNTLKASDVFPLGVIGVTNKNIAASNMISALIDIAAPVTYGNATYFSARSDGKAGDGSQLNPYNVATPSLIHATWDSIFATKQNNRTFIFLPGSYTTTNSLRITTGGTNLHFYGYGAFFKCTNAAQNFSGALFGNNNTRMTNASWNGFMADIGSNIVFATPPNRVWNGIGVDGEDITLKDLTFYNIASTGTDVESFGIIAGITNGSVKNCRVIGMAGPYTTAIALVGSRITCVGNTVDLRDNMNVASPWAFGLSAYCSDSAISGNIVVNTDTGLHMDNTSIAGPWENVSVTGNLFESGYPVRWEPSSSIFANWIFTGNTFSTTNRWVHAPENGESGGVISNLTFVGNQFTGIAMNSDGLLNFTRNEGIAFTGNHFSKVPTLVSGSPSIYGSGNTVVGVPDDTVFLTPGVTPFASMSIYGASMPVDMANNARVTNYNRFQTVGMTVATNTGLITVPKAAYYRIEVFYNPLSAGGTYTGTIRTNNVSTGIICRGYTDTSGRGSSAADVLYLPAACTVSLHNGGSQNTVDASLFVQQLR